MEGMVCGRRGMSPGHLVSGEDGVEVGYGECPVRPDRRGIILTDVVNAHTHCADYGLRIPKGLSLEELVAPPNGLKHRYLASATDDELKENMRRFAHDSASFGSSAFVDFRENGLKGVRMLREAAPDAVILGRPTSREFDSSEVEDILDVADGIGISSISDMDHGYIEDVADVVRERRKIFAIHVSERIREDIDFVLSLDPAFVVHMCEATDSDIAKCAEAEVPIVTCPTSNMYFGKVPPLERFQRMGADVAIGTDNGMLRSPDMVDEAGVYVDIMERQGGDPDSVFGSLCNLSGKILNRHSSIPSQIGTGSLAVLLTDRFDASAAFRGAEVVRVDKEQRGCGR